MTNRASLLSLVLLLVASVAHADPGTIYKWTDKDGNVHFTDCPPPPGCVAETVEAQAAPSAADVEQARQRLEKLLAEQERAAAVREEERLERERVFLDDEAHKAEIARMRKLVLEYCVSD